MYYDLSYTSLCQNRLTCLDMYYELGYKSLCQNWSTYLDTYYELGYFGLITSKTCQNESEKLINCVKANQPILA